MEFYIVVLFAFMATFTGANALSCYSCHGSYESDCAKNSTTSATVQKCYTPKGHVDKDNWQYFGANNVQNPDKNTLDEGNRPNLVATCGYIKWKDNPVMGDMVARGCRYTLHGKGFCERVEKRFKTVVNCQTCTSDLCNA